MKTYTYPVEVFLLVVEIGPVTKDIDVDKPQRSEKFHWQRSGE